MAKEHLTSFEPVDVLEVVLRCESCRGELSFPMGREPRGLDRCPTCLVEWDRSDQDRAQGQLKHLVGALRYFSNKSTRDEVGKLVNWLWTVQLVIEDEPGGSE